MVRRTKEEAVETRKQILDAAERVFGERGVSRTSLTDIAEAASVTRGAIYFVTPEIFEQRARAGDFLESATVHGNRYGTSRRWVEEQLAGDTDIVLEIDWQGAAQVRGLMPAAISIFILPPSFEALLQRLNSRAQDAPEVIATRLANAREEISHVHDFYYVIINSEFKVAVAELQDIVRAERLRTAHQLARHTALINRLK